MHKGILTVDIITWLTVTECLCRRWLRILCVCHGKIPPFPRSCLITGFLIWVAPRMPLMNQELLIFTEAPGFILSFHGVHVAQILVFCVVFCRSLFVLFLLSIVLSVLRFTVSEYPFDIFKFFVFVLNIEFSALNMLSPLFFWPLYSLSCLPCTTSS